MMLEGYWRGRTMILSSKKGFVADGFQCEYEDLGRLACGGTYLSVAIRRFWKTCRSELSRTLYSNVILDCVQMEADDTFV